MRFVLSLVALATIGPPLHAHGAVWRPPGISGPGAPTTGGNNPGAFTGGSGAATATAVAWEVWWAFNREPYLPRHVDADPQTAAPAGFLTGRGKREESHRFSPEFLRRDILPALALALRDSSIDVADSAVIALARTVPADQAAPFFALLKETLRHRSRTPQQAAVVGLGVLGGSQAGETLREILRDTPRGRALVSTDAPVEPMLRGLAALSLGFLREPESVPPLLAILGETSVDRELASACVLSLGLHPDSAFEVAPGLAAFMEDPRLDRFVRGQIPIALSRLPGGAVRGLMARMTLQLQDGKTPLPVRQSLAIALGRIATAEDTEAIEALLGALSDPDEMVRNFACIGLGRIGEAHANDLPEESLGPMRRIVDRLLQLVRRGDHSIVQPYAALALGLFARNPRVRDLTFHGKTTVYQVITEKLEETFREQKEPSFQAALGVALGLAEAEESIPALRAVLRQTRNRPLQGYLAQALGLLADGAVQEDLRALLQEKGTTQAFQLDLVRALGLLKDRAYQDHLVELLQKAGDLSGAASAAKGLGLMGDSRVAPPLLELLRSRHEQDLRRAFAVVALGLMAEKTQLPFNVVYSIDSNYTLPSSPLGEVLSIL